MPKIPLAIVDSCRHNEGMTTTQTTKATEPHAYVPTGVGKWRTCSVCGIGANASVHKAVK